MPLANRRPAITRTSRALVIVCAVLTCSTLTTPAQTVKGKDPIQIFQLNSLPATAAPGSYFTGDVEVQSIATPSSNLSAAVVTFQPGARTAWHTHPLGQLLIVTAGEGRVQAWGEPVHIIRTGDAVWIPAGEKHWHGAAPGTSMTHIAVAEQKDGSAVVWMEKVSNEQYSVAPAQTTATPDEAKEKPSAKAIGDFDPKLAQITDDVLYGDVWERPEMSKRDRSLITVAALIAMNRPDQLRSHLIKARENGVTEQELIETITQMAFYAGWPNAVTAVGVAREVFQKK